MLFEILKMECYTQKGGAQDANKYSQDVARAWTSRYMDSC